MVSCLPPKHTRNTRKQPALYFGKGFVTAESHAEISCHRDIVDVKDLANAEVHTIILGPLSPANDILGEESD